MKSGKKIDMAISQRLGIRINKLMCEQKVSEQELAERINCSMQEVQRIIEGDLILPPYRIEMIANALGLSKSDLLQLVVHDNSTI